MELRDYAPLEHFRDVEALWRGALGQQYPISRRALFLRLVTRGTFEPADGVVALEGGNVVGFGSIEIQRDALAPPVHGGIQVLMIHPDFRRRGIGSAILARLEQRAHNCGMKQMVLTAGLQRFWSGVPDDLPDAGQFFEARGYPLTGKCVDLNTPLAEYQPDPRHTQQLHDAGAEVVSATAADVSAMLAFQAREFPGWQPAMIAIMAAGDVENILLVKHAGEIVGSILTYTPQSRYRGANVVWEGIYGREMGGYGAVGIAAAWRGKGLGAAMCQAACLHIKRRGGTCAYIDWTGLVDFYAKVGAKVCRTFRRGVKTL